MGGEVIKEKVKNPLFRAEVILAIPNIAVRPTLEDMQSMLNKTVQSLLRVSLELPEWKHSQKLKELQIKVSI
jgi:dynein heavy chain, axonemal